MRGCLNTHASSIVIHKNSDSVHDNLVIFFRKGNFFKMDTSYLNSLLDFECWLLLWTAFSLY